MSMLYVWCNVWIASIALRIGWSSACAYRTCRNAAPGKVTETQPHVQFIRPVSLQSGFRVICCFSPIIVLLLCGTWLPSSSTHSLPASYSCDHRVNNKGGWFGVNPKRWILGWMFGWIFVVDFGVKTTHGFVDAYVRSGLAVSWWKKKKKQNHA